MPIRVRGAGGCGWWCGVVGGGVGVVGWCGVGVVGGVWLMLCLTRLLLHLLHLTLMLCLLHLMLFLLAIPQNTQKSNKGVTAFPMHTNSTIEDK